MSKRPFNRIKKIEKKENIEAFEDKKEQQIDQIPTVKEVSNKGPMFNLDKKKNIYDALKKNQDNGPPINQIEIKTSVSSKPSLFKNKKQGNRLFPGSSRNVQSTEQIQQDSSQAPKPTPLVIKKRLNLGDKKQRQRQNVVIQEEEDHSNKEQSKDFDESTNLKQKPDLKIKKYLDKQKYASQKYEQVKQRNKEQQQSHQKFAPVNFQYREINIQPSAALISEGKIEKQKKRTNELKKLLNLETDLYEQTLSMSSVTPYQIYINKIKSGFLKNSNDQSFDEKSTAVCQTQSFQYCDFTNQCPQDYSSSTLNISKIDDNEIFDNFILKVAPVIEELIKPSSNVTSPPIFLLAFKPIFKSFIKCPYPIFIYHSQEYKLDLIVMGEKLFITEGDICSVLVIGKNVIAGLRNGIIVLWDGENSKGSRLYDQIKQITQSTNFQLPSYQTNQIERYSAYFSQATIVSLLHETRDEFSSVDSSGKLIRWRIESKLNHSHFLEPLSMIELKNMTLHPALIVDSIKKRNDNYFINSSIGIICLNDQQIKQKLDNEGIKIINFELPKKSNLIYAICQDNSLRIYNELYSHKLFDMPLQIGKEGLKQIILPQLQHDNRQINILYAVYLIDGLGNIFQIKILQNRIEQIRCLNDGERDRSVIFQGVNRIGEQFETVRLMKDLKIKSFQSRMGINLQKTIPNLKNIVQKNRQIISMLEFQTTLVN